jgi:hypothetical protein
MDEHKEQLPTDEGLPLLPSEEQDLTADGQEHGPEVDDQARLSRREFMKAAALSAGSLLLLLSRCRPLVEFKSAELPPIPENFRRFYLAEKSTTIAGEMRVLALGSQCPDLTCALWLNSLNVLSRSRHATRPMAVLNSYGLISLGRKQFPLAATALPH